MFSGICTFCNEREREREKIRKQKVQSSFPMQVMMSLLQLKDTELKQNIS